VPLSPRSRTIVLPRFAALGEGARLPRTAAYDDLSHGSVRFGQPALAFT
jgi:hypothetical protein